MEKNRILNHSLAHPASIDAPRTEAFASENFQRQSCSAVNYLLNGINTGDGPVCVKFGPKGTDRPQQEGCAFRVLHAERCAVGVSRPCSIPVPVTLRRRPRFCIFKLSPKRRSSVCSQLNRHISCGHNYTKLGGAKAYTTNY